MAQPRLEDLDEATLALVIVEQRDNRLGREAAARLFQHNREGIYRACRGDLHDHARAIAAAEDATTAAWQALDRFGGEESFEEWLFAIVEACLAQGAPQAPDAGEIPEADLANARQRLGRRIDELSKQPWGAAGARKETGLLKRVKGLWGGSGSG